jgi:type IV pilus assembly protein PilA
MKNALTTLKAKKNSKKGFTLMEMLIVVAIIAILVAIAIPVFSAQLNTAKQRVDEANLRSATSMAVVAYLNTDNAPASQKYYAHAGTGNTMTVDTTAGTPYAPEYNTGKHIEVVVTTGGAVDAATGWVAD